jgi:hypothetical protein
MSTSASQDIELGSLSEQVSTTPHQAPGLALPPGSLQNPISNGASVPATAPIRSNSGSWWQRHVKRNRDTLPDEFEVRLKQNGPSEQDNLLQDYAKIKDHLTDEKFILEFLSFDVFPTLAEVLHDEERTIMDSKASFGVKLGALRSQLRRGQALEGSWALRLW